MTRNRIILLGASNLTLSWCFVSQQLQQQLDRPRDIYIAIGHGRAYGISSQMLFRGLPGIAGCGLWQQLKVSFAGPTIALLTDIGNDIMYELPPERILLSIEWCVRQLQNGGAQIIVTNLPIASIERLAEWCYIFFRNLFYPRCQLSRNETISRVRTIHAGLIDMATRYRFKLIEQEPHWFGLDGIHVKYRRRSDYYREMLSGFCGVSQTSGVDRVTPLLCAQQATFAYKTLLGREFICPQPSVLLSDGSRVFKY